MRSCFRPYVIAGLGLMVILVTGGHLILVSGSFAPPHDDATSAAAAAAASSETVAVLPLCPPSTIAASSSNSNVLIVSTLDGKISALDPFQEGEPLWSISTAPGDMISSTISNLELTNNGKWVKLIPSLAGGLYKFDGETVEATSLNAETLLKASFKFADNTFITGTKDATAYGIDLDSGNIRYECDKNGCLKSDSSESMDDLLIIQRETQIVRAMEPRNGQEKWNFSVSQHHLDFQPGVEKMCQDPPAEEDEDWSEEGGGVEELEAAQFKAVVSDGIICSVDRQSPDRIHWIHKFASPIVHAWHIKDGKVQKVDLFSTSHIPNRSPNLDDQNFHIQTPLLYIGAHNKQLYIQESDKLQEKNQRIHQVPSPFGQGQFPKVSWRPYLISADSRTPIINHGSKIDPEDQHKMPLLTYDDKLAENTAMAVFTGSDYPFDSGLYLFQDDPEGNPILDLDDSLKSEKAKQDDYFSVENETASYEIQIVQVVFVSLEYWWKEVVFISMLTALMMNLLITRPLLQRMRENFRQKLEIIMLRRQPQTEYVMVEVPVQVPKTPDTGSTGTEFSFKDGNRDLNAEGGEFVSRYISDYESVKCLGKGGFGVVFEAKNKIDDIHYAVKRIRLPKVEEAKKKVMREVKCLAKLDHKNIVRYFNTWLEKPPPGWQESQDAWWREGNDMPSTVGDIGSGPTTANPFSITDPFSSGDSSMNFPAPSWRDSNSDSSGNIVFRRSSGEEDDDKDDSGPQSPSPGNVSIKGKEHSSKIKITDDGDSSDSDKCADALEWDEKKQKALAKERKARKELEEAQRRVYLYIVMQLCKDESLRGWLRNCKIERTRQRSLQMFSEICLGVQYVHSQGLIHRDLKPNNIFFSADGTIKIGDFGLVTDQQEFDAPVADEDDNDTMSSGDKLGHTLTTQASRFSQHTDQVGTELYMSPEQLAKKPYNHKVDIYSLGLILFELLVPFSTQMERVQTLSKLRSLTFPSHFHNTEEFSLVRSMLAHDPEERPESSDILEHGFLQAVMEDPMESPKQQRTKTISTSSGASFEEALQRDKDSSTSSHNTSILEK